MKCPRCQVDDVLVSTTPQLRLLSFVFTTIRCPSCSGVFAVPDDEQVSSTEEPSLLVQHSQRRRRKVA